MTTTKASEVLQELGLSEIEALVYTFLLQNPPSTGYRISHGIGKPTANTYKAIASLEQQGAVIAEEGENRLVRAVPPEELLGQMERSFRWRRDRAAQWLSGLDRAQSDERVYSLTSVDQLLERAKAMLRRTERIALLDIFPGIHEALAEDLERTAGRGVRVVAKVYRPIPGCGFETVVERDAARIFALWPGQQLTLVRDAEEHLLGLLDHGLTSVRQAVWSRSLYLSCMHHNHVAAEISASARRAAGELRREAVAPEGISLLSASPPGLLRLQAAAGLEVTGTEQAT